VKFGRHYRITIQNTDGTAIVVQDKLTIQFNIHRSVMASLNGMTLQIYNLSATHRNLIFQDRFDTRRYKIIVEMGYDNLTVVFIGDIYEANSTREGTNIVTTIDARDGNFDTNQTLISTTLAAGTTLSDTLEFLAGQFPNLSIGKITNATPGMQDILSRPVVLEGNVYQLIQQYANPALNNTFIDLAVINIQGQNEVFVNNSISLIDASTGLIDTPRRDQSYLTVTTLLEPRIVMGQIIDLVSSVQQQYNGIYKVTGVTHRGIISEAVNGNCYSIFNMVGNQLLGGFSII